MSDWKKTQVWQRLSKIKNDEADKVRTFLSGELCMDRIEKILNTGSTSPKDFTLHDADHSFRVAERMWELIPLSTQKILSEYELAFLLLSAYLHDIGMTPEYKKVNNHFVCLNTKTKTVLTPIEKQNFQKWLDEEGEHIDIEKDILNNDEKAAELITFYCRYKHNDWSEEWIRKNFKDKELGNYTNWLNDLVNICRSHHYGLDELKSEKFNPLRIHGKVVHKRYIAMCLRLADVIEIDPERAPDVLIKHRSIINGSLSHWLKEKFTSIYIDSKHCISVTAHPTKAFIHKAISDVADQIEQETNLCNTLNGEIPLRNISPSNDLKHEWNILPSIYRGIKEAGNYEFIDGTFKPNSKKLLQLLAGTELYGNPILAIRELIQNSLDAVKVQMAYKIIEEGFTKEEQFDLLKTKFSVWLTITKENDDYWITCNDNGVGMDKEIIKKFFLVGGATKRHELLELERKCNKIGYNLEVTGQFGIGVMSYFMIADKMLIKTKKSFQSGNHEATGWEFEINGLSDFGELRKVDCETNGTSIKLRIKKELIAQIEDGNEIISLLRNNLFRIPCNFKFITLSKKEVQYSPGWCKDKNYFKEELVRQLNIKSSPEVKTSNEFLSEEKQSVIEISNQRKSEIDKSFLKSIDFLCCEGKLENDNGYYRIHIPVFKNKKGDAFAFFFEKIDKEEIYLQKINEGFLFHPSTKTASISWKGIAINNRENHGRNFPYNNCFIELDLINEKSFHISVSRLDINYSAKFQVLLKEIEAKISELILGNKKRFTESTYSLFNHTVANCLPLKSNNLFWTYDSGYSSDFIKFEKIKFPLIFDISTDIGNPEKEYFVGKPFYKINSLRSCGSGYRGNYFRIDKYKFKFDKAVFHNYYNFRISFLKLNSFKEENKFSFLGNSSNFPPSWKNLFCFRGYHEKDIILNENSSYFKYINKEDFVYVKNFFEEKKSLNESDGDKIIQSKSKSLCFMLYLISLNEKSYWDGVTKNNKLFVKKLWTKMFGNENGILYFFFGGISTTNLTIIAINSWTNISQTKEIQKYLPLPDIDWQIESRE
ncbi:MAG: ATP-binding protein [Bacteroidota bacterium]